MPATSDTLINQVANWLMAEALKDTDLESVVMGCCERLQAAGVPISRGYFAFTILHPLYHSMGITWNRGEGVVVKGYTHVPGGSSKLFPKSPHGYMLKRGLEHMRVRLDANRGMYFPIFDELREQGIKDYLAFTVSFSPGQKYGMLGSWATDQRDGFTDKEIEALLRIQDRLAVACKMAIRTVLTRNVVETYLGKNAGDRVLDGQIHRGDGESIEAAIWYSDLRGSTAMADRLPRQQYIDALNAYFDAAGGAVVDAGGEILSFIGDAMLAIFPAKPQTRSASKTCKKALLATYDAFVRLDDINAQRRSEGLDTLAFGVGLHCGEVMFGNVGVQQRLTFSVFGSAVNEVVRIENLTSQLGERALVSDVFAASFEADWRPMGRHILQGIEREVPIFAPGPAAEVPQPS